MNKYVFIFILFMLLIAFWPIAVYFYCYKFYFCNDAPDTLVGYRVFLSGPFLIMIGLALALFGKKLYEKVIGVVGMIIGIAWIVLMIAELFSKP